MTLQVNTLIGSSKQSLPNLIGGFPVHQACRHIGVAFESLNGIKASHKTPELIGNQRLFESQSFQKGEEFNLGYSDFVGTCLSCNSGIELCGDLCG